MLASMSGGEPRAPGTSTNPGQAFALRPPQFDIGSGLGGDAHVGAMIECLGETVHARRGSVEIGGDRRIVQQRQIIIGHAEIAGAAAAGGETRLCVRHRHARHTEN
jgi:hypothetical protein